MGRETGKEGSGVVMILDSPEGKVYSYAIRLNFHASEDSMDYEALLVGLVTSARRGMKDLHVFVDSKMLVDQALKGLAPIKLELLNQEVSVGIKTRPTVETARKDLEETRNEAKEAMEKLKSTWEENNGSN
ncbi:reverse transcriptase domain-containing protein [Tanacetum coccineum]